MILKCNAKGINVSEFIERKIEKLDDLSIKIKNNNNNNNNNNPVAVHNDNQVGFKIRMGFNHGT